MKKFCILLTALFLGLSAGAQTPFQITFGPYLQNVTADGATVIWGTSADALSWVEAAPDGEDHFYAEERPQYYQTKLGKRTVGRLHTVRITGLKPRLVLPLPSMLARSDRTATVQSQLRTDDLLGRLPQKTVPLQNAGRRAAERIVHRGQRHP